MSDFVPHKADPPEGEYKRIDWSQYADGDWWQVHSSSLEPISERRKDNHRKLVAARAWASKNGFRAKGRSGDFCRAYFIKFTPVQSR